MSNVEKGSEDSSPGFSVTPGPSDFSSSSSADPANEEDQNQGGTNEQEEVSSRFQDHLEETPLYLRSRLQQFQSSLPKNWSAERVFREKNSPGNVFEDKNSVEDGVEYWKVSASNGDYLLPQPQASGFRETEFSDGREMHEGDREISFKEPSGSVTALPFEGGRVRPQTGQEPRRDTNKVSSPEEDSGIDVSIGDESAPSSSRDSSSSSSGPENGRSNDDGRSEATQRGERFSSGASSNGDEGAVNDRGAREVLRQEKRETARELKYQGREEKAKEVREETLNEYADELDRDGHPLGEEASETAIPLARQVKGLTEEQEVEEGATENKGTERSPSELKARAIAATQLQDKQRERKEELEEAFLSEVARNYRKPGQMREAYEENKDLFGEKEARKVLLDPDANFGRENEKAFVPPGPIRPPENRIVDRAREIDGKIEDVEEKQALIEAKQKKTLNKVSKTDQSMVEALEESSSAALDAIQDGETTVEQVEKAREALRTEVEDERAKAKADRIEELEDKSQRADQLEEEAGDLKDLLQMEGSTLEARVQNARARAREAKQEFEEVLERVYENPKVVRERFRQKEINEGFEEAATTLVKNPEELGEKTTGEELPWEAKALIEEEEGALNAGETYVKAEDPVLRNAAEWTVERAKQTQLDLQWISEQRDATKEEVRQTLQESMQEQVKASGEVLNGVVQGVDARQRETFQTPGDHYQNDLAERKQEAGNATAEELEQKAEEVDVQLGRLSRALTVQQRENRFKEALDQLYENPEKAQQEIEEAMFGGEVEGQEPSSDQFKRAISHVKNKPSVFGKVKSPQAVSQAQNSSQGQNASQGQGNSQSKGNSQGQSSSQTQSSSPGQNNSQTQSNGGGGSNRDDGSSYKRDFLRYGGYGSYVAYQALEEGPDEETETAISMLRPAAGAAGFATAGAAGLGVQETNVPGPVETARNLKSIAGSVVSAGASVGKSAHKKASRMFNGNRVQAATTAAGRAKKYGQSVAKYASKMKGKGSKAVGAVKAKSRAAAWTGRSNVWSTPGAANPAQAAAEDIKKGNFSINRQQSKGTTQNQDGREGPSRGR